MTQTISGPLDTHYGGTVTTIATGFKATRTDGTVFGFTDHDQDKTISGVTYLAASGYTRDAVRTTLGLNVDNTSIMGAFSSAAVTEADLRAGKWDGAAIEIFEFNWADLSQGVRTMRKGTLGQVSAGRLAFEAELLGLLQRLQQEVGRLYGILCDTDLGNANRCKVRIDPPAWAATTAYTVREARDAGTGSVVKPTAQNDRHFKCTTAGTSGGSEPTWDTTIGNTTADGTAVWTTIRALKRSGTITSKTDDRVFFDSTLSDYPDGWFDGGKITMDGGLNAGIARNIKQSVSSGGEIRLQIAFPFAVAVSDAYTIEAGCLKRRTEDCATKFDNVENHQGFPDVPGAKVATDGIPLS